jgi:hypothetical protein
MASHANRVELSASDRVLASHCPCEARNNGVAGIIPAQSIQCAKSARVGTNMPQVPLGNDDNPTQALQADQIGNSA